MEIKREQLMALLLGACPSFLPRWKEYLTDQDGEDLVYLDVSQFAEHLVDLAEQGRTAEFEGVFDVVERLHLEGDDYVRELATIGLLEDIQDWAWVWKHRGKNVSPETFLPLLIRNPGVPFRLLRSGPLAWREYRGVLRWSPLSRRKPSSGFRMRPQTARWWRGLDDFRTGRSPWVRAAD